MTAYTLTATATDAITGRSGSGTVNFTTSESGLPTGVTLQQIDGGPAYYSGNGFTYAASTAFSPTGLSWDDPRFFPIASDYAFYPSNSTATFFSLGLNFAHRVTGDTDMSYLRNAKIWAIGTSGVNVGAESIGEHIDEPSSWNADANSVVSQAASFGDLRGRLLHVAFTWNQAEYGGYGDTPGGSTMQKVMTDAINDGGSGHIDIPAMDIYWYAGAHTGNFSFPYQCALLYNTGQANVNTGAGSTPDQIARNCHYGDQVDWMRSWTSATGPASHPIMGPYIETEDALAGAGAVRITPIQMNAAVWSSIIHGARGILYFGTTSNFGSTATFGFSKNVLSGQSISIWTQGVNTNSLVRQFAAVLNSPKALGYFTVTPPPIQLSATTADSGIDATAKYCANGFGPYGNGFYIIAATRNSQTATNLPATFTTADRYSGVVKAVNADGGSATYGATYNLTAVNGVFTDTFTTGCSVRIYYIP